MKKLLVFVCVLTCLAATGMFFVASNVKGSAEIVYEKDEDKLKDEYVLGESISLPDVSISYNGQTVPCEEKYLIFPDGIAYSQSDYILEHIGKYKAKFYARIEGKTIFAEKDFTVSDKAFSVTTEDSKTEFCDNLLLNTEVSGLKVTLQEGEKFTFNQPINLSSGTGNEPVLKFYPYSYSSLAGDTTGTTLEAEDIYVTLTDCYNPDVFLEFNFHYKPNNDPSKQGTLFVRVKTNDLPTTGLEDFTDVSDKSRANLILDDRYYLIHKNDAYGTSSACYSDKYGYGLYYDTNSQEVHVNGYYWRIKDYKKSLISDLDNEAINGNKSFSGFTTGEVYLTISAENYIKPQINFEIENIFGIKGEGLNRQFYKDENKPLIKIEGVDSDKEIFIAKDEPFSLLEADAYDVNLKGTVKKCVYYNYGTPGQTSVGVYDDVFIPKNIGKYTVVYSAEDTFGNISEKLVVLNCLELANNKTVTLETEKIERLEAGKPVEFPEYEVNSVNGNPYVKIFVKYNGEEDKITEIKTGDVYIPQNTGKYSIIYEYGDLYKNYVFEYEAECIPSDAIRFGNPVLPEYFIKGAIYSLDEVLVYTYTENMPEENKPEVYISCDDKQFELINYSEFVIGAEENVCFKYKFGDAEITSTKIPVVDVGFDGSLKMQNYFVGEFDSVADSEGIQFTSKAKKGDSDELKFINTLSLQNFNFTFSIPVGKANFESLKVVLTDYYQRDKKIELQFNKYASSTGVSFNGEKEQTIDAVLVGPTWSVWYNRVLKAFVDFNGLVVPWNSDFTSDKVLFSVSFVGMNDSSDIRIKQLNNQNFSSDEMDTIKPIIFADDRYSGIQEINTIVTLYAPDVTDVLTPFVRKNLGVRMMFNNKDVVTSTDGTKLDGTQNPLLDYDVKLDSFGQYNVVYRYEDQFGNFNVINFIIKVVDRQVPEIVLDSDYGEDTVIKGKFNSWISPVGYQANDNITPENELNVFIVVMKPNSAINYLKPGEKFFADYKGNYKVAYYCYDSEGNFSTTYYTISVK